MHSRFHHFVKFYLWYTFHNFTIFPVPAVYENNLQHCVSISSDELLAANYSRRDMSSIGNRRFHFFWSCTCLGYRINASTWKKTHIFYVLTSNNVLVFFIFAILLGYLLVCFKSIFVLGFLFSFSSISFKLYIKQNNEIHACMWNLFCPFPRLMKAYSFPLFQTMNCC